MLDSPLFPLLKASTAVKAILGNPPNMKYFENRADQDARTPYIVVSGVGGEGPMNYLSELPTMDRGRVQVDCYDDEKQGAVDLAKAVRNAVEPSFHMISDPEDFFDDQAKKYRVILEFDLFATR